MSAAEPAMLVTEEEYLRNPGYERSEYVGGKIVPRYFGTLSHGRAQGRCGAVIDRYFDTAPGGYGAISLHCRFAIDGELRFRLPDVCAVIERENEADSPYLERALDLAVEVRSPEDKVSDILRKLDEYFQAGTRLAWVILPEERAALVRTADGRLTVASAGDTLDGGDVLPGLSVAVDELFR